MQRWHKRLSSSLAANEVFTEALERQLPPEFQSRTGLDLNSGKFALVGAERIWYDADNTGHAETNLLGPGVDGWWVEVAWCCKAHPDERVDPATASRECDPKLWWAELPQQELRDEYGGPIDPPWPTSDEFPYAPEEFPFQVEWWSLPWPDAFIEIIGAHELSDAEIAAIGESVARSHAEWNFRAKSNMSIGIIHNMTAPLRLSERSFVIRADFGSAGPGALISIFHALRDAAGRTPIEKVIIRSGK